MQTMLVYYYGVHLFQGLQFMDGLGGFFRVKVMNLFMDGIAEP